MLIAVALLVWADAGSRNQGAHASGDKVTLDIRFADHTRKSGLIDEITASWGSIWADFNRDGAPDLLINRHLGKPASYNNRGGAYELFDNPFYPYRVDRHGCAWGEANGDGRPDLYCTQGAELGEGEGPNQLFLQRRSGFSDVADVEGVEDRLARGRSINWLDYDGDGDLDLFVGNALRTGSPNQLFENTGETFQEVDAGLSEELDTRTSSWSDWDGDGDPDLLVLQAGPVVAYENVGGAFVKVEFPGITDTTWRSAAWGDFDGDKLVDVHLVRRRESAVFRNIGSGFVLHSSFEHDVARSSVWLDVDNDIDLDLFVVQGARGLPEEGKPNRPDFLLVQNEQVFVRTDDRSFRGPRSGNGDAVSAADHDADGRVDLFVTNGHNPRGWEGRSQLLENRTTGGNGVGVDLEGDDLNPFGFGARIRLRASSGIQWRTVTDAVENRNQSDPGSAHFGIGEALRARIRVFWPDGMVDCALLRVGREVTVAKGTRPCI